MTSTALSPRQNRFVQAYCGHLNASRAAREAGYSNSSGADAVTGHRLLRNAKARRAIEALQQAKAVELELDHAAIIQAILGAIQTAQEQGAPATIIRGCFDVYVPAGMGNGSTRCIVRCPTHHFRGRWASAFPFFLLLNCGGSQRRA
jgi:hypothetical protein